MLRWLCYCHDVDAVTAFPASFEDTKTRKSKESELPRFHSSIWHPTNLVLIRWFDVLASLVPARRCCVARRRETAAPVPWPQDQIGAVATRRRPAAARTCGCKYSYFSTLCVFLGWRSNNVKLTSTMLRLLLEESNLYEVVNTSMTNKADWNEF